MTLGEIKFVIYTHLHTHTLYIYRYIYIYIYLGDDEVSVFMPNLEAGGVCGAAASESDAKWNVPMLNSKIDDW